MIRVGVMSDSHGRLSYVTRAVREMGRVDWLVHLGDHDSDASEAGKVSDAPLAVVCGNCDWFSNFPAERLLELGGVRVLLTHGHKQNVKEGLTALSLKAEAMNAQLTLYGHTHIPNVENDGACVFVNPGALYYTATNGSSGETGRPGTRVSSATKPSGRPRSMPSD